MSASFLRIGCRDIFNRQCNSVNVSKRSLNVLPALQNLFTKAKTKKTKKNSSVIDSIPIVWCSLAQTVGWIYCCIRKHLKNNRSYGIGNAWGCSNKCCKFTPPVTKCKQAEKTGFHVMLCLKNPLWGWVPKCIVINSHQNYQRYIRKNMYLLGQS